MFRQTSPVTLGNGKLLNPWPKTKSSQSDTRANQDLFVQGRETKALANKPERPRATRLIPRLRRTPCPGDTD